MGPKGYTHLRGVKFDGVTPELEKAVDFGFFSDLGEYALLGLDYTYRVTKNYGWSIVIISVLLNLIFMPLSMKSFKSAQAMKAIQEDVKLLQEKYKSDPKQMNVEIWGLYKKKGVNPFSGCLPMVLQIPIFWALFTMLRNAYELRGAEWILWIHDLSKPDVMLKAGGFPVPLLPLIMGVGMYLQQKMTASSSDPTQKYMTIFMPILFTVMFIGFPSGLVLYWLTNSVLSIIMQWAMLRKQKA
jgi:YidC/Oxa1 family membrane protein insertase